MSPGRNREDEPAQEDRGHVMLAAQILLELDTVWKATLSQGLQPTKFKPYAAALLKVRPRSCVAVVLTLAMQSWKAMGYQPVAMVKHAALVNVLCTLNVYSVCGVMLMSQVLLGLAIHPTAEELQALRILTDSLAEQVTHTVLAKDIAAFQDCIAVWEDSQTPQLSDTDVDDVIQRLQVWKKAGFAGTPFRQAHFTRHVKAVIY